MTKSVISSEARDLCRHSAICTIGAALLLAALILPEAAWPQAWPSKPILVVSTASPASSGDVALRLMAAKMSASLGQPVVVELKTAARGAQAAQALAKAGADGYTITYGTSGTYVNARFLFKNLAFDVLKDFAPISLAVSSPSYVVVNAKVPVNSLKELIDYAKRNPGKLEYASTGSGSVFHLTGESLKLYAGIDLLHVPYAQANFSQMINDWVTGRVALWFPTWAFLALNMPKVRPLAIVDTKRSERLPEIPTVAEIIPGFQGFPAWWAFFGPAGLSSPIAERLSEEVRAALKAPDVQARLNDLGLSTIASTPGELDAHLKREIEAVGTLAKAIGLEPE
jgi:tripartite-type tricarboxylate transporter receptor subunit TctC